MSEAQRPQAPPEESGREGARPSDQQTCEAEDRQTSLALGVRDFAILGLDPEGKRAVLRHARDAMQVEFRTDGQMVGSIEFGRYGGPAVSAVSLFARAGDDL